MIIKVSDWPGTVVMHSPLTAACWFSSVTQVSQAFTQTQTSNKNYLYKL